ncbi:MAG: tetratricopeptide repeat protein [Gammaproteobacteria bacterium]|nr:tetratricopeptide repeat protein [Gammaproteobacteria bacterium]
MSVINQMLRDLEHRKIKESDSDRYIDEVNIVAKRKFNLAWFILPLVIVLVISFNLYLHFYNQSQKLKPETTVLLDEVDVSEITVEEKQQQEMAKEHKDILPEKVSVKIETVLKEDEKTAVKREAIEKQAKTIIIPVKNDIESVQLTRKERKQGTLQAEKKITSVKESLPAKEKIVIQSIVKSAPKRITSDDLVYQAGQLMTTDQVSAIELLEKNIKDVKPDIDYYSLLANLQQRQKNYDRAIVLYRKALKLAPYQGELWIGLALAYRATGENEEAIKSFKKAITSAEISPELKQYAIQQVN